MAYEFTPVLIPFALAAVCIFLPWYAVDELSDERFRTALFVASVSFSVWSVAELLRISATTMAAEQLWHNLRFIGPAFGAVGYFIFTAVYTNHEVWAGRRRWLLFVVPILTTGLVWTNAQHMLVRTAVESTTTGPFVMQFTPGPWFVVHAVYSYALVAVGTWWIITRFVGFQPNTYFRKQTVAVLLSFGIIMSLNLAYHLELVTLDWTPVGGALWAIIFTIAVSEYKLFDLSPLAREIVVENMESAMVVTNTSGEVIDINHTATVLFDLPEDEIIGQQLDAVFGISIEKIEQILASESNTETLHGQQTEDRYYEVTVSPISLQSEGDIGRVITFTDVTSRVERQQQLTAQKQSLERQNERLDEFASVVSHDLRSPLSTIGGWADIAADAVSDDDPDLDKIEDAVTRIQQSNDRMAEMIEDLLMLARAGQTVEETEPVALSEVATEAWGHAAVDDCVLESTIPDETTISADRGRLLRIFENLYRNANDHNDGTITIRTGILCDTNPNATGDTRTGFYIEDDGSGIPAANRDEIFEHGYTTDTDGTGFGLSIVQSIVSAHGWTISVTTGRDDGARFEITGMDLDSH